jgi:signal recognition particle subunit SRP54
MFDALANGFRQAKNRLAGLTELTEQNIESALREVRLSLLEADVELGVVKAFLARVKDKALGEVVRVKAKKASGETVSVTAGDQFTKICYDELVEFMTAEGAPITFASEQDKRPTGIMMVGLQGSGKTTTTAKLARYLQKQGKKPMLVAADMQRPAAVEQLQVLGKQIDVPVFNVPGATPLDICKRAPDEAKKLGCDVVVYDTAGRLAIDEKLMEELASIKDAVHPENILLVVDAMIGQDAVKVSKGFHERLDLTGVVLTKLDGDARGGAALSVKEVTGAPVRFSGMGEALDKLDEFRPEGMASRVLGMGDVVGLMKDFEGVIDEKKAAEDAMRMLEGEFTLDDFLEQVRMIQKMGSLKDLVGKMPGMDQMLPADANLDDRELVKVEAIIQSFTKFERKDPYALVREPGRIKRIAKGCGHDDKAVQELVQKFLFMKQMMSGLGQNLGFLGNVPGMKQFAMANNMRKAAKNMAKQGMGGFPGMGGGFPGMPGMPPFPGMGGFPGMPGMGMPGMGGFPGMGGGDDSLTKMKPLSAAEKNAKKAQRKREKEARRKSRR